jgi:hypothetical protein
MEGDRMALSLLYLVLDVGDVAALGNLPQNHPAVQLRGLGPKQMREVREALYKALYDVLQSADINMALSSAMGKALCTGVQQHYLVDQDITQLKNALQRVVTNAINDAIEGPSHYGA